MPRRIDMVLVVRIFGGMNTIKLKKPCRGVMTKAPKVSTVSGAKDFVTIMEITRTK